MSATERSKGAARHPSQQSLRGLDALNFFLADVRDGLGPYLAIYLIAVRGPHQGWNEATTGLVMKRGHDLKRVIDGPDKKLKLVT